MKRIAVLREHRTAERQQLIAEIRERLLPMLRQRADCFRDRLVPELARHGIHLRAWEALSDAQRREAAEYFDAQVSAALTPLVILPSQPFPFFSNLSLSLTFLLYDDRTGESVDARVKVPAELPQWVPLTADVRPGHRVFVRLHEVIQENAHKLYPGMRLTSSTLFRLTRDAEVELDEDDEKDRNIRDLVREQIRQRRFEPAVRLEFAESADRRVQLMLQERFALEPRDVTRSRASWTTQACSRSPTSTSRSCATRLGTQSRPRVWRTPTTCSRPFRPETSSSTIRTRASATASSASSKRRRTTRARSRSR